MWVQIADGDYINLDQTFKIEANDQGDGTFVLIARGGPSSGLIKTASTFTSRDQAQAAIQAIVSGTTLTV